MCRSIKPLRTREVAASDEEVDAAALQFVRKVSGYRTPAKKNEGVFNDAVAAITRATNELLAGIETPR